MSTTDVADLPGSLDEVAPLEGREGALRRRYSEDPHVPGTAWNDVLATILHHRSVRKFSPAPLPEGALPLLVAAAQSAASSSNTQSWSVVAVNDPVTRRALADIAGGQRQVIEAPLFLAWIADLARAEAIASLSGVRLEALDYTEAFLVAAVDAALAAQNAVIAAESLGLGTVYIGALRNKPEQVAELLGLPARTAAVFGLCVGYPNPDAPTDIKPRLAQEIVLHQERYQASPQRDALRRYDENSDVFRAKQGLPPLKWTNQLIDRWRTVGSLKGRHLLQQSLQRLGFPLK